MVVKRLVDVVTGTVECHGAAPAYVTNRIEIPEHYRNTVLDIEVFNDNIFMQFNGGTPSTTPTGYQIFVSPYPCLATLNSLSFDQNVANSFANVGPYAGVDSVLFKKQEFTHLATSAPPSDSTNIWGNQYPTKQIASKGGKMWYSPHLYLTLFLWGEDGSNIDYSFSYSITVNQTKANSVEASMGCYAEFLNAQTEKLTTSGSMMLMNNTYGYTFPMWRMGGIRPELMISAANAVTYFNRVETNARQEMTTLNEFDQRYKDSILMQDFNEAFGKPSANIPDWITLVDVGGITSGEIRPYPPPLKFFDNGNTAMF